MVEITQLFERYRETIRSLWNQSIFQLEDYENDLYETKYDQFETIEHMLLEIMVLNQVNPNMKIEHMNIEFYSQISGNLLFGPKGCQIMFAKEIMNTWTWEEALLPPKTNIELRYIEFFDWNMYKLRDNRFYRFRVLNCDFDSALISSDILVEPISVSLYLNDEKKS